MGGGYGPHPQDTMTPSICIEEYSHGVRLSGYSRELFGKLSVFLEGLKLKEPRKLPQNQGGHMVMELKKRFYGLTEDKREAFIHRHHLPDLLAFLNERGIDASRIDHQRVPVPAPAPATYDIHEHFSERGYQVPIIEALADEVYSRRLDLQTGKGKLQPLYSRIKVPGGWSTMGEMEVGTEVTAWDGTTAHVTGVFPNGTKPVYRVTFGDGRYTDAGPEHLWKAFYVNTVPHRRWRVIDTMELKRMSEMPNPRVYVPLCESEDSPEVDVTIPPYTLGVILGDGGISGGGLFVTKHDDFVFEEVLNEAPAGSRWVVVDNKTRRLTNAKKGTVHPYKHALQDYELWGCRSWEKYIPHEYINGSTEQRWSLLQGLMDTDGTVNKPEVGGTVSFSTTSRRMAGQVQYLVRSLGGIASLAERNPRYTYKGEELQGRPAYQVNIRHPLQRKLFRLPRKRDRLQETNQYSEELKLRVRSVEYLGEETTQCISIDHPDSLYVTDDFIVTHNTFSALAALARRKERAVVMVYPKYFGIWEKALTDTYRDIEGRYCTISGADQLKALMHRALDDELPFDVIIISNTTYRSYIESYERFGDRITEMGYPVPPPRFHELVKAGTQINDEFQDDPGLVFRIDIFSNLAKQIYLSATPFTGSDYVTRMIDVMLPPHMGCPLPEYDRYINVVGLLYNDPGVERKDYLTPFKNTYNHARYEKQMMKKKRRLERYFKMVKRVVKGIYAHNREEGQKLLILCATVDFIRELTKFINLSFPDLTVGLHVSGSDYRKLQTNDITISTIKSSGTGVDIPDLREVLLLQATDSKKDNIQILGRTRHLKNYPGVNPRMTYMVCLDIPTHVKYHRNKQNHFDGRVLSHKVMKL